MSYLVKQGCFLSYKFPEFYRFLGVEELAKAPLLERYLTPCFNALDSNELLQVQAESDEL